MVFTLLLSCGLAAAPFVAVAQTLMSGGIIESVRIEGAQRIEPATVRSYMRINPGEPFDPERLDASLKSIFSTGLFADVSLARQGNTLIVRVVENPIINLIAFEGNKRIDDETLSGEVQLRSRLVFTRTKVQRDVQRLLEVYRRSGRFAATVEPKVIQLEQNRVNLVFEIDEGPLTRIESILFVGNRAFSDGDLREEIVSSEYSLFSFLSATDTYDADRIAFDRDLLRQFYRNEGYADFAVLSVVSELVEDREGFIVTFTIDEGERYRFGTTGISVGLRNLDPESLREGVAYEEGDWYDASKVEKTISAFSDALGNFGFAFVDVAPQVERDSENRIINLRYEIREGPKVFIERIEIEGNFRTLDRVVRREFRVVEGDAFNVSKLRRSRTRVQNLGFFSRVDLVDEPGSQPDRAVVKVEVDEQATGSVSFGLGISSAVGPVGSIGIQERNLLGRGQDIRLNLRVAGSESQISFSFTEPYFLDRNVSAGFDLNRIRQDRDESSFKLERIGGGVRFGFDLSEQLRQTVSYSLQYQDFSDFASVTSPVILAEEGSTIRSVLANQFSYDTRDSRFDPSEGYQVALGTEIGGLGGDARFLKAELNGAYYTPVTDVVTLSLRGGVGRLIGLGDDTSVVDRFELGGTRLRGFAFSGVGPRDALTDDSLGGENFYLGTVEVSFPVGLPDELAVRGRVFSDFGATWDTDDRGTGASIDDSSSARVSAGVGFSWDSPFGPFVLDLGFPLVKEDFDETELVSFSFGTSF